MDQQTKERNNMNNICIAGQLGKDAEVKFLSNGDPVASFSIADSQGKDKPTIWWNCALFGKRAESLAQYLTKGQSVTVTGQVTEREWTDKEGIKRKQHDIRVNDVALQGGKREEASAPKHTAPARKPQSGGSRNFADMDDDIPFASMPRKALHSI